MNDRELANACVALGVGSSSPLENNRLYCIAAAFLRCDQFVRDWRVAGAMMEKLTATNPLTIQTANDGVWYVDLEDWEGTSITRKNESLPRAIIEACCEALA